MKLTIELVPQSAWFTNLRSMLPAIDWDILRRATYARVGHHCEICNGVGTTHPVECHEKWLYDDDTHVCRLIGLCGLCPSCHEVKHIGLAQRNGRLNIALAHLCKVNNWSESYAYAYAVAAMNQWRSRSEHKWTVDISWAHERLLEMKEAA